MGFILIAIILIVLICCVWKWEWYEDLCILITVIFGMGALFVFILGLAGVGSSFDYTLLHESFLTEKNVGISSMIDGVREASNYYENVELDWLDYEGNAYELSDEVSQSIVFLESDMCDKPVIQLYEKKEKKTFWTFALAGDTYYIHVIKVPIGTVSLFANDMAIEFG